MTRSADADSRASKVRCLKFTGIFVAINLHQLAESFPPVFVAILLAAMATLALDMCGARLRVDRPAAFNLTLVGLYLVSTLAAYIHSLAVISTLGATIGLIRFLFAFPVFLASLVYIKTDEDLRRCLVAMAVAVAILYLSVPWQIAFGQLPWLPSEYERGGFARYASLLGNVTAVGIALGFYLAPALFLTRNANVRMVLTASLILSGAASLSKAALMNAALIPVGGLLQGMHPALRVWRNWSFGDAAKVLAILAICVAAAFSIAGVRDRMLVNLASYGLAAEEKADDVSINESVVERLAEHPSKVFEALRDRYSEFGWLTGAGFGMSSTALVPDTDSLSIMAHNQFVDVIGIGGISHLLVFMSMLLSIGLCIVGAAIRAFRRGDGEAQTLYATLVVIYVNFLVNLPFANGLIYQPLQASMFWLLMAVASKSSHALLPVRDPAERAIQQPAHP